MKILLSKYFGFSVLAASLLMSSAQSSFAANPDGNLRIEINSSPNFVVDSNVESPSTYAPRSAYLGAVLYNDGATDMTNVFINIGNYIDGSTDTPGVYPSRAHMSLVGPLPGSEFALTHEGGSAGAADAVRYIGTIPAGESVAVYWLVSYPNLDENGDAVHGPSVKPDDDLWLEYDVWATATSSGSPLTADVTEKVTMRNEISASANKIMPSNASAVPQEYKDLFGIYQPMWTNTTLVGTPGVTVTTEGYWFNLGNVSGGFDNDGDLVPDNNAWLQPVGDPSVFDSSAYRLVRTYALLIINGGEQIIEVEDDLYFQNLPDNNSVVGMVRYEFMPLLSGASSLLTPYQEAASGNDNEKFNGDYGTSVLLPPQPPTELEMEKNVDKSMAWPGGDLWYEVDYTNAGLGSVGVPALNMPLVIQDSIPAGTYYVSGSAAISNTLPTGVTSYDILFSTNNGTTWVESEPAVASNVTDVQWWLSDAFDSATAGQVTFSVTVDDPYNEPSPIVLNVAGLSFGNAAPFLEDDAATLIFGENDLGDTVFLDDGTGGGVAGNGIQDGTESGIQNITVDLYMDNDQDGVLDSGDVLVGTTTTDSSGLYAYTNLADGMFLVQVDDYDPDLPFGSAVSLPTLVSVDLDSARTNLAVSYLDADFGFVPVMELTKSIIGGTTNREGDIVTYEIVVTNSLFGDGGSASYRVWAENYVPAGASWESPENAYIPPYPDGQYATNNLETNPDVLELYDFRLVTPPDQVISNVAVNLSVITTGTFDDESLQVEVIVSGSTLLSTNFAATNLNSMLDERGELAFDVTAVRAWQWSDFNGTNVSILLRDNKDNGPDDGNVLVDAAGFRIITDWIAPDNDPALTLNPVPLVDTYDADKMKYVSSDLEPQSVVVSGSDPDSVGTITWNNIGPIYAGGSKKISAEFKMLEPPSNISEANTNTVAVTDVFYGDGRPANSATASVENVVLPGGTIGDYVWRDLNSDGVQDGGDEAGIGGVSVRLTPPAGVDVGNGDGNPITNLTDSTGLYLFEGLPADGTYTVAVLTATLPGGAGTCTYDEDDGTTSPDSSTVVTLDYDATDGSDTHLTADFGYTVSSSIDGTVWNDMNRGGETEPDSGEPWLTSVTVYLFDGTSPGTPGEAIASTTTDADGYFVFSGAYSGDYCVQAVTNTGDMSSGTWTRSFDTDGIGTIDYVVTNIVSGGYGRADFSYYETGAYDIGDTLFYDWGNDGVQDASDEGVNDIAVYLYHDSNANGVVDLDVDALVGTDVTDSNGMYLFESLIPDNYIVQVDLEDNDMLQDFVVSADPDAANDGMSHLEITNSDNLDQDFGFYMYPSLGTIGDTVWVDYSGDGIQNGTYFTGISNITISLLTDWNNDGTYVVQRTTVTDTDGWYEFTDVPEGDFLVRVDTNDVDIPSDIYGNDYFATTLTEFDVALDHAETYLDADFGFAPLGVIGDMIFWDSNRSGEEDVSEGSISGVTVELYIDNNGDGYYDGGDTLYATNVSTSTGYIFHGLPAGDYVVVVDTNSGPIAGTQLAADPSCDGLFAGDPAAVDADSEYGVTLTLGQRFYGADFGYVPNGIIGDTVWLDVDGDGIRDDEENGIAFITVELYTNGTLVATNVTDSDGWYIFQSLPDDTYTVVVDTNDSDFAAALLRTYDADGTLDDQATDVVISGGHLVTVDGNSFTNELGIDFGYRYVGSNALSGTIGLDAQPYDGLMGTGISGVGIGESPFPSNTVYLYLWNDDGDNIPESGEYVYQASTLTATNGDYSFTDLPDGDGNDDYIVSYAPLVSDLFLTTTNGSTPATIVSNNTDASGNTISAWQAVPVALVITNMDFAFRSTITYDFGDLPAEYGTLLSDDGARHVIGDTTNLYLGASVDTEDDGVPTVGADGDGADEDGVSLISGMWLETTDGGHLEIDVGEGSGWLVGFVDFNNDGEFSDSNEMIINEAVSTNGSGGTGIYTNDFTVPAGTFTGTNTTQLYARFRLFEEEPNNPAISYIGSADNGEVEDYRFEFGVLGDYVWKDQNGDGIQDPEEPGLESVRVFVDLNDDGIYQATEPTALTDTNGYYTIGGFVSGTFNVRVDTSTLPATLWPSYDLDGTNTPHVASLTMTGGQLRGDVDYGYFPGYIDVGVLKTVDDAPDGSTNVYNTIGSNMVFTMTVTNYGPLVATELEFTDNLPTSLTYVTHSTSTGTYDEVSGIWDIGTLAVDGVATMMVSAVTSTSYDGASITNWIYLTDLYQEDTNPTNNQDDAVIKPTAVVLSRFEALTDDGDVVIEWETSSEVGAVGFYLMRKEKSGLLQVNEDLLPTMPDSPQGGIYSIADSAAEAGKTYTYMLVEVEAGGTKNDYGPFKVEIPDDKGGSSSKKSGKKVKSSTEPRGHGKVQDMDFGYMKARAKVSKSKELRTSKKKSLGYAKQKSKVGPPHYTGDDPVMKVVTEEAGVVVVTADQFIEVTGADTNEVREMFQDSAMALSCNGVELPYVLNAEGTEISFYADKIDSQYTEKNVYMIQSGNGLSMTVLDGEAPEIGEPATSTEEAHFEQDVYSVGALIPDPDADHLMWSFFVGDNADYGRQTYTLASPGFADGTVAGSLVVRMQGGSSTGVEGEHIITVVVNGTEAGSGSWAGTEAFDLEVSLPGGLLIDGDNEVVVVASKDANAPYSVTYLNEFDLTYPRKLEADGDVALLKNTVAGALTVGGFTSATPVVWDIDDPAAPVILGGINAIEGSVSFNAEEGHDYVIFGQSGVLSSPQIESIQLGVLKSETNNADYVIITVRELSEGVQVLADYRTSTGLTVATVMLEDIYNEFSYGIETPEAIKEFLSYAYSKWQIRPGYVVLAGEGSYDYKGTMGTEDCLIPPMLLSTPQGLFASDNWFVDFDNDRIPEIPLGRLPVLSNAELTNIVDKIIAYEAEVSDEWQSRMLLVADDVDAGGNFSGASDALSSYVPESYNLLKAYLDNGTIDDARAALIDGLNAGSAFMSYFGHSGLDTMANEGLLTADDIESLVNGGKLPVVTSMSCMMGRFALPGYDCLAEELLLKENGGCIAVWTPTGMSLNTLSRLLSEQFYSAVFEGGESVLGDAIIAAMHGYAENDGALDPLAVYGLLGDPALRISGRPYKKYNLNQSPSNDDDDDDDDSDDSDDDDDADDSDDDDDDLADTEGAAGEDDPSGSTTTNTTTATVVPTVPGDGKCYNDYDGDGVSDLCIFDDNTGKWYIHSLAKGTIAWGQQWGWANAKPIPGDYDGDGNWDLAVFDEDTGMWFIQSLTEGVLAWEVQWGWPGAIAVPGDYDGDGTTDMALFDSTTGGWYILSTTGSIVSLGISWGWEGAIPVVGDYNGDGSDDLAVYDSGSGDWYILSMNGDVIAWGIQWGWTGTETIPGDYDGDGIDDLSVFEADAGAWYIMSVAEDIILWETLWGWVDAVPVPGDYDGDGRDDLAVFDNETGSWYILSMTGEVITWGLQWGWSGSEPVSVNDRNRGHGNDADGYDEDNPGNGRRRREG